MGKKEERARRHEDFIGGIFQYLRAEKKSLPQRQKEICDYILNNYQQAAFLTVEELAKATGTSPATVLRTATRLGFESYSAVKEELQKVLYTSSIPPLDRLRDTFAGANGTNVLDAVIEENIQNLKGMKSEHLSESFPRAVELLVNSRRIYVIGLRSTKGVALYLQALLQQFLADVFLVDATGTDTMLDVLLDMNENDVLVALMAGSPHYTKRTISCVQFAAENGIPTVLITNSLSSAAAPLATELLHAPQNTSHYSSLSLMTICDALVAALGSSKFDAAHKKIDRLGKLLMDYDISI
ncbi:MAG: MurR/RpiR family transcriptional regulator [Thermovirgaceae bacterium]